MRRPEWLDRGVALLFPKRCVLCGEVVEYERLICGRCEPPRVGEDVCGRCGRETGACSCHQGIGWAFDRAAHALRYQDNTKNAVVALKEFPEERIARFFAREMLQTLDEQYPEEEFDLVTAVPTTASKMQKKGFNHAALLSHELGELAGIVRREDLLYRDDQSQTQHQLNRKERMENALNSYQLQHDVKLDGLSILLVDDVFTTGATVHACAAALREGGADKVFVLTATGTYQTLD